MKKYPKYKETGVEWIAEIPTHWNVKKMKNISFNCDNQRIPLSSEERGKRIGNIPYYGANGIIDYINDYIFEGEYVLIGEDGAPFFLLHENVSFVVKGKFWVNNHAHILKIIKGNNSYYYMYVLNSVDYKEYITGSTRDKLNQSALSNINIPSPSFPEQTQIANFLDRKTKLIDTLIEKKQKQIELLKEQRAAVINQAVTKGLNPDVPMKDSGVEWIGEIPEYWDIKKIKYLSRVINGSTPKSSIEKYWDGEIVWITPDDLGKLKGQEIINSHRKITTDGLNSCGATLTPKGSVIISTRAPIGHIGLTLVDTCTNQGCKTLKPLSNVKSKFLYYLILSAKEELKSLGQGSTFTELPSDKLKNCKLSLPSLPEQNQIVNFLDKITKEIENQIGKINQQIDLLKEYRTTLISEAVTGKIDVRSESQMDADAANDTDE